LNLKDRYNRVLEELAAAAAAANRHASDIRLIAVSKTHPVTLVDELAALGQVDFGENRIAELVGKQATTTAAGLQWHLIGQLQTNKVKQLTADVLLHTLDRLSLAEKLQQKFAESQNKIEALIQVNCSREPNKSGVSPEELGALCDAVAAMPAIQVSGLMTIAENSEDEKTVRSAFALLRELSEKTRARGLFASYKGILSMGMSGDFALAIAEGATHVRIGSAIFGNR
jgi:pyridoxal phosphate enzyme (YggS family)